MTRSKRSSSSSSPFSIRTVKVKSGEHIHVFAKDGKTTLAWVSVFFNESSKTLSLFVPGGMAVGNADGASIAKEVEY